LCGIAGAAWSKHELAVVPDVLRRMLSVLRHRGPDDEGMFVYPPAENTYLPAHHVHPPADSTQPPAGTGRPDTENTRPDAQLSLPVCLPELDIPGRYPATIGPHGRCSAQSVAALPGVALGHRRLAIIDRAGGRQPHCNEDGTLWLVCNGEIYNYRQLRSALQAAGHRFRTRSDSEVIVHLYEEHGAGFLQHLVGMFALALWDARSRQLLLARDRLGQKPLVYFHQPGRLIFASQLKALLEVPGLPRQIDPCAIDAYLTYQYVPHPMTIFRGYRKLPPGQMAIWHDDRLELRPYWQPQPAAEQTRTAAEYIELLREALTEAVRSQLESEVPLGVFLSGGIDSTIVTGLMRRLGVAPLRSFTISFSQPEYDESRHARAVAAHFGTEHHEFRVEPAAAAELLPQLAWHYDEPFADSSALPTWQLAQMARQHITVALSGDGGDELFAGYQRYAAVQLAHWLRCLPAALRGALFGRWWQALPAAAASKSPWRRWLRFVAASHLPPQEQYLQWVSVFDRPSRQQLYTTEFAAAVADCGPEGFVQSAWERFSGRDSLSTAALTDLATYLPCDLMTKVDTATMAHALECRQPFLDHRVVELAAAMPIELKWRMWRGKHILRIAFADLLPTPVRRRRKMGFGVPLDHWFRGDLAQLARDLLLDRRSTQRGYFQPQAVAQLLEAHQQRRAEHSHRLWALLMLELWHRQWADGSRMHGS